MKHVLSKLLVGTALVVGSFAVGCSDDNNVDSRSGKAISDLDIGGDLTLDKGATQQMTAGLLHLPGERNAAQGRISGAAAALQPSSFKI